jgi:hypothetical protein
MEYDDFLLPTNEVMWCHGLDNLASPTRKDSVSEEPSKLCFQPLENMTYINKIDNSGHKNISLDDSPYSTSNKCKLVINQNPGNYC